MKKRLFELILSIKRKCQANEEKIQTKLNLTAGEFNGLLTLNSKDEIPGIDFAERMSLSPSRGSRVLYKLTSKGFVNTESKPDDRRSVLIKLTPSGLRMKKQIEKLMEECENRICSAFSQQEVEDIKKALIMLNQAL